MSHSLVFVYLWVHVFACGMSVRFCLFKKSSKWPPSSNVCALEFHGALWFCFYSFCMAVQCPFPLLQVIFSLILSLNVVWLEHLCGGWGLRENVKWTFHTSHPNSLAMGLECQHWWPNLMSSSAVIGCDLCAHLCVCACMCVGVRCVCVMHEMYF